MPHPRLRATAVAGLLAAALTALPAAQAVAATPVSVVPAVQYDRTTAARVQHLLDTVLGPGAAQVTVAAEMTGGATTSSSRTWAASPGSPAFSQAWSTTPTGSASSTSNAVGSTATTTVTPAGGIVHQSIAVAVDPAAAKRTGVAALRRLVAAAAGVLPARGDRVVVAVAPLTHAAVPAPASPSPFAAVVRTAAEVGGGLVALLVLLLAVTLRGRRTRRRPVEQAAAAAGAAAPPAASALAPAPDRLALTAAPAR